MKRYDCEWTPLGAVMEEHKEGAFVPFSEISGLADTVVRMGDRCTLLSDLLRELRDGIEGEWCFPGDLAERINAALAGKLPEHAVSVTETIRTAPERIWLQVGDQAHYHSEPFPSDTGEVTWCADSVVGCEVPYVRADLVGRSHAVPEGWQMVPLNPTEDQWDGLARAIVFWMRSYPSNQHTPCTLVEFITSYGHAVPKWMEEESELLAKDHVISKGTIAVLIYKAMLAAAPKPECTS